MKKPYLSVVVCSRNDDHGGHLLERMQVFLSSLLDQCRDYNLDIELILVEWNPPVDRPKLKDVLDWSKAKNSPCQVRIIEVSRDVHKELLCSENLVIFQMIAKNVGIRRARGEFILATNIDVIFSNELIEFLSRKKLNKNFYYRVERWDLNNGIPPYTDPYHLQKNFCEKNIEGVLRTFSTQKVAVLSEKSIWSQKFLMFVQNQIAWILGIISLFVYKRWIGLFWKTLYWPFIFLRFIILSDFTGKKILSQNIEIFKFFSKEFFVKLNQRFSLWRKERVRITKESCRFLHTNGCGDFTLVHRDHWFSVSGYIEFPLYSLHIDSLLLFSLFFKGIRERVLVKGNKKIYHMDHGKSYTGHESELKDSLRGLRIPKLLDDVYCNLGRQMEVSKFPFVMNKEDWGLLGKDCLEHAISSEQKSLSK